MNCKFPFAVCLYCARVFYTKGNVHADFDVYSVESRILLIGPFHVILEHDKPSPLLSQSPAIESSVFFIGTAEITALCQPSAKYRYASAFGTRTAPSRMASV